MWKTGTIKTPSSQVKYFVKCFDEASVFGIEGGRISKLTLQREDMTIANYDRGWDLQPVDEDAEIVLELLMNEYN